MEHDARYTDINNGRAYPPLTRVEAYKAARRILRALGSPSLCAVRAGLPISTPDGLVPSSVITTRAALDRIFKRWTDHSRDQGRKCWAATKPTTGHDKGWGRLIHDVSHMLQQYRHPKLRAHDSTHHQIERDVQLYVETSGMLNAKPETTKGRDSTAYRAARYVNVCERLKRWESKRKRAETAIRKLSRQKRRLESIINTQE